MIMTIKMTHSGYFNAVSVMDTVPVEYDTRTVFFSLRNLTINLYQNYQ